MPPSENPYQSPNVTSPVHQEEVLDQHWLWRKGSLLVMDKKATLPDRCVKSNVPTKRRLRRSFSWHHPAIFLAIPAGIIIYMFLAVVLHKKATIRIGLSDEWFAKRRNAILIGWASVAASIGVMVCGILMIEHHSAYGWLIVAGIFIFLVGVIYSMFAARMVAPNRISDTHVWLKGVCPEFLEGLPEWPHWP